MTKNSQTDLTDLSLLQTKSDVDKWILAVIGEDKECEKNLLTAILLFMNHYTPAHQHTVSRIMKFLLCTKVPKGARAPRSDLDIIMEQLSLVSPHDISLWYYDAYTMYPDTIKAQAAANAFYKVSSLLDTWPTFITERPPIPCDGVKLFSKKDVSNVNLIPEEFTFY